MQDHILEKIWKKICFGKYNFINSWKQINCYFCEKKIKKNFMLHPVKLNVSYQEKSFFKFSFFLSFSVTWSKRGDNGMRKQDGGGGTRDCESGIFFIIFLSFFLYLFSLLLLLLPILLNLFPTLSLSVFYFFISCFWDREWAWIGRRGRKSWTGIPLSIHCLLIPST